MLIVRQSLIATGFALSISTPYYGFLSTRSSLPRTSMLIGMHVHLWFVVLVLGAVSNKLQFVPGGECASTTA